MERAGGRRIPITFTRAFSNVPDYPTCRPGVSALDRRWMVSSTLEERARALAFFISACFWLVAFRDVPPNLRPNRATRGARTRNHQLL